MSHPNIVHRVELEVSAALYEKYPDDMRLIGYAGENDEWFVVTVTPLFWSEHWGELEPQI